MLAPTLFGIFFAVMLKHAFGSCTQGFNAHTRSDGRLFNPSRPKAKTKVWETVIRDMIFADDAALVTHSEEQLQSLVDCFSRACMTISIKETNVMGQGVEHPPEITIDTNKL